MKKADYIIAIDPDAAKSGVAFIDVADKSLISCDCLEFPQLIEYVKRVAYAIPIGKRIDTYVEAAWLKNTANYHKGYYDKSGKYHTNSSRVNENISNKNGRNHETGRKIVEMLRYYGIEVQEVQPLRKGWSGPNGKITQGEIEQFITGFPKRSNSEMRDAVLIGWDKAELPMRIKVQSKLPKP